jgi:hypothetical protein
MKSVVNAVSSIVEDVRSFERRPQRDRPDIDLDTLSSLRERAEATLSNLVTASKTHATSSGMSPVSLLDAAASHVSATITEIGRMVSIRKATKAEQDQSSYTPYSPASVTNGFSPSLRSVDEVKTSHQRKASGAASSSRRGEGSSRFAEATPTSSSTRPSTDSRRRPPSENSSSDITNSPPPIFDQRPSNSAGIASDDSALADGSEDAWAELKVCLHLIIIIYLDSHPWFILFVALPRSPDRINCIRYPKRIIWGSQSNTFTDPERKSNTNNHDCVEHCRCL